MGKLMTLPLKGRIDTREGGPFNKRPELVKVDVFIYIIGGKLA